MKLKIFALFAVFVVYSQNAYAEMIVLEGRYITQKDEIRGYFYREKGKRVVFDIRWGEFSTKFRCQDEYDKAQVKAASLNFVLQVTESRALDLGEFLHDEGFRNCKKF